MTDETYLLLAKLTIFELPISRNDLNSRDIQSPNASQPSTKRRKTDTRNFLFHSTLFSIAHLHLFFWFVAVVVLVNVLIVNVLAPVLDRLRRISVPEYFSRIQGRGYVPECEALARELETEEITSEYLACLCSLLADVAPHLHNLMEVCGKKVAADPFDIEGLRGTWSSCPLPIREFIFEKGLLKNTSREVDASLRFGFLWDLIVRNQSSNNFPGLSFLLGLYMRMGRSHTEKMLVLSKLRICPSKTTLDRVLPSISESVEMNLPPNSLPVFAFDNHQQQFSMTGGARDLARTNMAHSVTRSMRYIPSLPATIPLDEDPPPLSRESFKANPKERAQIRECNRQFFLFAADLHLHSGRESLPELSLGSDLEEIMEQNQVSESQILGEEEEEEDEDEDEEGGESLGAQNIDPALPIEDFVEERITKSPAAKQKRSLLSSTLCLPRHG